MTRAPVARSLNLDDEDGEQEEEEGDEGQANKSRVESNINTLLSNTTP
jgi:hypothetical protein